MPQEQRVVNLIYGGGMTGRATATGNSAAWLCPCGYRLPLIGHCESSECATEEARVACRECDRAYLVVPEGEAAPMSVKRVEEIPTREASA